MDNRVVNGTMKYLDLLGDEIQVGDYIAHPTKYGGMRVNEIMEVVKLNPKSVSAVKLSKGRPSADSYNYKVRTSTITNFGKCVIIDKQKAINKLR